MPLKPGVQNIGANIKELEQHGTRPRGRKQILAIALHTAYGDKGGTKLAGAKKRKAK